MTTKGALWIWLSLLAIRGLVVFCFYAHYQQSNVEQQEAYSGEMQASPPQHHYSINQVHAAGINFFVLN